LLLCTALRSTLIEGALDCDTEAVESPPLEEEDTDVIDAVAKNSAARLTGVSPPDCTAPAGCVPETGTYGELPGVPVGSCSPPGVNCDTGDTLMAVKVPLDSAAEE